MAQQSPTRREAPNGFKRYHSERVESQHPRKKKKILPKEDDWPAPGRIDHDPSSIANNSGDTSSSDHGFIINEEFARRFEHNKKREELQKRKSRYRFIPKNTC